MVSMCCGGQTQWWEVVVAGKRGEGVGEEDGVEDGGEDGEEEEER